MLTNGCGDDCGLRLVGETGKPEQYDASRGEALAKHEFSVILVGGDEWRIQRGGTTQNDVVFDARIELGDIQDVVPITTEAPDDRGFDSFVAEEIQAASSDVG